MIHQSTLKRWSSFVALLYILTGVGGTWTYAHSDFVGDSAVAVVQAELADTSDAAGHTVGACAAAHASCHAGLAAPLSPRRAGDAALGFRRDILHLKPSSLIQVQVRPPPKAA